MKCLKFKNVKIILLLIVMLVVLASQLPLLSKSKHTHAINKENVNKSVDIKEKDTSRKNLEAHGSHNVNINATNNNNDSNKNTDSSVISEDKLNYGINLQTYFNLTKKELFNKEELELFKSICSSKEVIDEVTSSILNFYQNKSWSEENEMEKIKLINFLAQALSWKSNPQRTHIIEQINKMFFSDINHVEDIKIKKSLAVDKAELYQMLYWYAPQKAQELEESAQNTDYAKFIDIAKKEIKFLGRIYMTKNLD